MALERIRKLPADDPTRFVLRWLWRAGRTDGKALTLKGRRGLTCPGIDIRDHRADPRHA
jgi:hypothetical protein